MSNLLFHAHLSTHISLALKEVLGLHGWWDVFERLPVIYALGRSRQHHGVDVGSDYLDLPTAGRRQRLTPARSHWTRHMAGFQRLQQGDGDGIGLLPGGTRSTPNA